MISVVFPAYNEEGNIAELHRRLVGALSTLNTPFEIVAVNDASQDKTLEVLRGLAPIRVVTLASRSGQSSALDAGIHAARGDVIITLDADLQNDPNDIPRMYHKLQAGYDAVVGWRQGRKDPFSRKIFSAVANVVARRVLGLDIHDHACALKMFKREFLADVHLYGEMHVFLAAILHYRGARLIEMPVAHHERRSGLSKHNFIKGIKDLADLLTIRFLFSTSRPLLLFGTAALISWAASSAAIVLAVVLKVMDLRNFAQTPLPVIASLFIMLGFILVMGGFLAELVLRVYYEGRDKTHYRIREIIENN
ncbi:MAG: glycosyltransferase family 2 protein [Patescibacteria group bacterium]